MTEVLIKKYKTAALAYCSGNGSALLVIQLRIWKWGNWGVGNKTSRGIPVYIPEWKLGNSDFP